MKISSLVALILVGAWFDVRAAEEVESVLSRLMSESSCSWCVSLRAFNASVTSNMAVLAEMDTADAKAARAAWCEAMLSFPVSTNDYRRYRLWMNEKVQWTSGCSNGFVEPNYTNIWLKTADLLHGIRMAARDNEELLQQVSAERSSVAAQAASNGIVSVSCGMPGWYWKEVDQLAHCQRFSEVVRTVLVDQFGKKGIPRLPPETRWSFYTNFVERASLNDNDRAKIREAIDKAGVD